MGLPPARRIRKLTMPSLGSDIAPCGGTMRRIGRWRQPRPRPAVGARRLPAVGSGIAAASGLLLAMALTAPATAGAGHPAAAAVTGPVSTLPASGTPQLAVTGTTEQIRQLRPCGGTMYAVGTFTGIRSGNKVFTRHNIFSFSANAPYRVTAWNPNVNGTVNSIAFNGGDCSHAYIGGQFTSVHGTRAMNIAEISTTTGAVVPAFGHSANALVETLLAVKGHLLTGGFFTSVNGSTRTYF